MGRCQGRKQVCYDLGTGIVDSSLCAQRWRWVLCVGTTPPGLLELLKAQVTALGACDALTIMPVPDKFRSQETHLGREDVSVGPVLASTRTYSQYPSGHGSLHLEFQPGESDGFN